MPVAMIDLDGTLVDSVYAGIVAVCGRFEPCLNYGMENFDEETRKAIFAKWADDGFMETAPVIDGATYLIRTLAAHGWDVYGLTVRRETEMTKQYCRLHFPEMKDVIFVQRKPNNESGWKKDSFCQTKADVVREFDADLFVDDCVNYLKDVNDNTECPLVIAVSHPHNCYTYRDLLLLDDPGRIMIRSLSDIADIISM